MVGVPIDAVTDQIEAATTRRPPTPSASLGNHPCPVSEIIENRATSQILTDHLISKPYIFVQHRCDQR
jgi:hypothetical protein